MKLISSYFFPPSALRLPIILTTISLFVALFPVPGFVPAILLLAALCIVFPLPKLGYITRGVLSVLLIVSFNTLAGLMAWGLNFQLNSSLLIISYSLILLAGLLGFSGLMTSVVKNQKKFLRIELVGVVLALIAIGVAIKPLEQGADAVALTRIMTFTDDNPAHVKLVKHVGNYGGYLYGNRTLIDSGTRRGDLAYPQGWHFNTALATQLFTADSAVSPSRLLLSYYLVASIWVGALAYLFTLLVLLIARTMHSRVNMGAGVSAIVGIGFAFFISTIYPLFAWGAHPQIASFALLLALLVIIHEALLAPKRIMLVLTTIALMYIAGISYIYYFELPLALLFISIFLLIYYRKQFIRFWKNPSVILFTLLVLVSLVPVAMYLKYTETSQAEVFSAAGGTLAYNNQMILALILMAILYSFQKKSKSLLWAGVLLACSVLFMAMIMLYQYQAMGSLQYYAFKASHAVILLCAVILAVSLVELLSSLFWSKNSLIPLPVLSLVAIVAFASLSLTNRHPLFDIFVKDSPYGLSENHAVAVVNSSSSSDASKTLSIGSCQSYFDARAMNMLVALSGKTTPEQTKVLFAQYVSNQKIKLFDLIKAYQASFGNESLTVISSDSSTTKDLQEYLGVPDEDINIVDVSDSSINSDCPLRLS